ncbi:aldo/keto reductase [Georgenia sp. SYP-B2076]|uniref:aldo/keto reductase n=1 Tax=Georgenia sp. SYP-B2076 TaxID=2495881 RepID=UPI00197AE2A2|nr:aldo/keto reductase [Georgenia sp. SYP-B2076]
MTAAVPSLALAPPGAAGRIPLLGFGTWQARGAEAYAAVCTALEVGYRHVDTATMYGNEREVGRAIADSGVPRDEIFVTTKCPPDRVGRETETLDSSLRDLRLDRVDLWLVHWPPHGQSWPATWEKFIEAQAEGRAGAIGVSNYSPEQIDELTAATGVTPAIDQIPWSPADHDAGLVAALRERGVVLEGYSPFKRTDMGDPTLRAVAAAHDATPQQVVLAWHRQRGFVVIPKSASPERIASNFASLGVALAEEELDALDGLGGR